MLCYLWKGKKDFIAFARIIECIMLKASTDILAWLGWMNLDRIPIGH